jgi:hypothetical protein
MSELAEGLGRRRSRALVIGVDRYESSELPDLPGARAGAERFATALADASTRMSDLAITRQMNPTRTELVRAVAEACDEANDQLVVYFAGHGVASADGELVLAGRDCDPRHPELTGIAWESLRRELAHATAPSLLVLLDVCGAGAAVETHGQFQSHFAPPPPGLGGRTRAWGTQIAMSRVSWPYQPGTLTAAVSAGLEADRGPQPLDGVETPVRRAILTLSEQPPPLRLPDKPREPGAPKVFLSHRFGDPTARSAAALIDEAVTARFGRQAVFRAQDSLPPGVSLPVTVLNAARHAQALFLFIGEGWESLTHLEGGQLIANPADFVVAEIDAAMGSQVPIVPILVGNRGPLRSDELPQELRHLALRQYLQLPRDLDRRRVATLIDRLFAPGESQARID